MEGDRLVLGECEEQAMNVCQLDRSHSFLFISHIYFSITKVIATASKNRLLKTCWCWNVQLNNRDLTRNCNQKKTPEAFCELMSSKQGQKLNIKNLSTSHTVQSAAVYCLLSLKISEGCTSEMRRCQHCLKRPEKICEKTFCYINSTGFSNSFI